MTPRDRQRQHRLFLQHQAESDRICDQVYEELWSGHRGWFRRKRVSRPPRKKARR